MHPATSARTSRRPSPAGLRSSIRPASAAPATSAPCSAIWSTTTSPLDEVSRDDGECPRRPRQPTRRGSGLGRGDSSLRNRADDAIDDLVAVRVAPDCLGPGTRMPCRPTAGTDQIAGPQRSARAAGQNETRMRREPLIRIRARYVRAGSFHSSRSSRRRSAELGADPAESRRRAAHLRAAGCARSSPPSVRTTRAGRGQKASAVA